MKMQQVPEQSGVYTLLIAGPVGPLELEITVPSNPRWDRVAIIGHPHPLQGGTMHNKVVTTLVRVFTQCAIPTLRFNFRGVGQSFGVYDAGQGESEDLLCILTWWLTRYPEARVLLSGFSFGSYVAYRAALQWPCALLVSIAPPVHHYDFTQHPKVWCPWLIVQGTTDEVVSCQEVTDFIAAHAPDVVVDYFQDTGHFFHGRLVELKTRLLAILNQYGWIK